LTRARRPLDYTDVVGPPFPFKTPLTPVQTPAYTVGATGASFDTSTPPAVGIAPYTISALKISIRVWDERTNQARQITIIQDM
jgi:hypothetical protein